MDTFSRMNTDEAVYNIGAVARLTSIPVTTLHAWERRYGFPHPTVRTPGGHRLYSEKDVALLRRVKGQLEQGITASQAVAVVQRSEEEDILEIAGSPPAWNPFSSSPAGHAQLTAALLDHDLARADSILAEMLAFSSPEQLTLRVIGPVMDELGQAWEAGRITVTDEHLASNYLRQRLMMWLVTGTPPRQSSPIVLACAPGEWHEGSLLMLGVLLRRQGWPVAYLGQDVPFEDLASFIDQTHPHALVLVAMLEETARKLAEWPNWIRQSSGRPLVTFAGRAFVLHPELKGQMQGLYLGDTVQDGMMRLEELLRKEENQQTK